jgi:hypothetical protein
MDYILDFLNQLRSEVAMGEVESGNPGPQPPAANMRKLVSELGMVSETSLVVNTLLIN